jgi:hypothetical protein
MNGLAGQLETAIACGEMLFDSNPLVGIERAFGKRCDLLEIWVVVRRRSHGQPLRL